MEVGEGGFTNGLTLQVAGHAVRAACGPLPAPVLLLAKQCVLDWVAVALVGSKEPVARLLRAQAIDDGSRPIASAVGGGIRVSAVQAALINGAAGHAIDYDDANIGAQGHITAAVLPATLAIAQAHHASGLRMLQAFAAGYHAAGIVGHYVGRGHYERGFHGTGTVGSFGAAVAAALLLELDVAGVARAMGIAGTQAAGLKAQFGTMCKPFHAGKAAENGVRAAQLAAHGFTSREDILEVAQGFCDATSPHCHPEAVLRTPPGGHHLFGNLFKYHASCYGTHSAIEALTALRRQHDLVPAEVRRVELRVERSADHMCNIATPRTGLEAKFSLRFNAALALAGEDTSAPVTYTDRNAARGDLCRLRDLVTVRLMPETWPGMVAEVVVETIEGWILESSANSAVPCADLALQGNRLLRKFRMLATPVVGLDRTESIAASVGELESMPDTEDLMSMIE